MRGEKTCIQTKKPRRWRKRRKEAKEGRKEETLNDADDAQAEAGENRTK